MHSISFYRQQRRDGGIRMGLAVDCDTVLHCFQEGEAEPDPVLLWFVDVRAKRKRLPEDADEVRRWFLEHATLVKKGLRTLAQEMRAGMDVDEWPFQWPIPGTPREPQLKIVCSVSRRFEARDIARVLTDIAEHWTDYLTLLQPEEPSLR